MPSINYIGVVITNFKFSGVEIVINLRTTFILAQCNKKDDILVFQRFLVNLQYVVRHSLSIQVATFVALTMHRKMEIAQERQGRPIAAAT